MKQVLWVLVGVMALVSCATTEGYRQQTATYVGTHGDVLLVELGPPVARDTLSNGGEVWTYYREQEHATGGYNRPVTRSRTIRWRNARGEVQTRTETYTDYEYVPPRYWSSQCETRFILDRALVVRNFRFEGNGCVAPEIADSSETS